jgi:hypothetical protein
MIQMTPPTFEAGRFERQVSQLIEGHLLKRGMKQWITFPMNIVCFPSCVAAKSKHPLR